RLQPRLSWPCGLRKSSCDPSDSRPPVERVLGAGFVKVALPRVDRPLMETMHGGALPDGLYEAVISNRLGRYLAQLDPEEWHAGPVDPRDPPHVLANYFSDALRRRLEEITQPERLALVNALLAPVDDDERVGEARRLLGVERVG